MFGIFDLISYTYAPSIRKGKTFRKTDGMHGTIKFNGDHVGYESGLEKIFATMMAIDPQVTEIIHQPMRFQYEVTGVNKKLVYTPDYRIKRDTTRQWIWGNSLIQFPNDAIFEVKPQEVLDKLPLERAAAQGALIAKIRKDGEFVFHIFTNQSIPRYQVENIMRVGNANPTPAELKIGLECVHRLKNGAAIALDDLKACLSGRGLAPYPVITGLMKNRHIVGRYFERDFLDTEALVIDA